MLEDRAIFVLLFAFIKELIKFFFLKVDYSRKRNYQKKHTLNAIFSYWLLKSKTPGLVAGHPIGDDTAFFQFPF